MKKFKQKDYINVFVLIIIFLLILFSIVGFTYVNGSTIDWSSQHWIIPEYFRNLYYKTGDLFPSFAFNLGAGQNIYNLSYYGLLSPMVTLSYLFKTVSMINYIMIFMVIVVISSIVLMYYWLHRRFDTKYAVIGTLLFLLAAPLIYHTHRHIMFVDYMPFLLMALIGVDLFFEKNKKVLLTISIFLIIMTSYYYSITAILCILLYGIYKYIEYEKEKSFKNFIVTGLRFIFPILVGVLMSAVLIFPTFYALLNGRGDITSSVSLQSLLIPSLNFNQILYDSYTIGVTSLLFLAIAYSLSAKHKGNRMLSIIFILLTVFPIIIYALTGFMYVRGKVLIPLLPIAILFITNALDDISVKKNTKFLIILLILFGTLIGYYAYQKEYIYMSESILLILSFFLYKIYGKKNILIYVACFSALVICLISNYSDTLVTKEDVSLQYNTYNYNKLSDIIEADENVYRLGNDILGMETINRVEDIDYYLPSIYSSIENQGYTEFYNDEVGNEMQYRISSALTSSKNIIFNTIMGVKYLITNSMVPVGYTNVEESNIYVNENVFPLGYSTSNLMSKEDYDLLSYPDNIYALLTNIIIDKDVESEFKSYIKEETLTYDVIEETVDVTEDDGVYKIDSDNDGIITLELKDKYVNKLLFISFDMGYQESCSVGDTSITINGVTNTLSCKGWPYPNNNNEFTYVISSNDTIDKLNIEFTKGKYEISNIKVYVMDYKRVTDAVEGVDTFKIDKTNTTGDTIKGIINVSENGYFVLNIPYDKGFSIYLDGSKVEYEKVNDTFMGFAVNEGQHEIEISYISPYLFEGLVTSLVGYMIFLPIIYSDFRKKKRGKQ